jgi:predicted DNA-binding protein (UPF0251 family)
MEIEAVFLSLEELEAIRLADLEGLEQEEVAQRMGVSRRALWEDLQYARMKIADALVSGKAIEIRGGNYILVRKERCTCQGCHAKWEKPSEVDEASLQCPDCGGHDVQVNPYDQNPDGHHHGRCCGKGRRSNGKGLEWDERRTPEEGRR